MAPLTAPPQAARLVASDVNLRSCSCEECDLKSGERWGEEGYSSGLRLERNAGHE